MSRAIYEKYLPAVRREPLVDITARLAQACQEHLDHVDATVISGDLLELILHECNLRAVRIPAPKAFQCALKLLSIALADGGIDKEIDGHDMPARKDLKLMLQRFNSLLEALDSARSIGRSGHEAKDSTSTVEAV